MDDDRTPQPPPYADGPDPDDLEQRMRSLAGLDVPPEPSIDALPSRTRWQPAVVMAAAAALVLVLGLVAVVARNPSSPSDLRVGVAATSPPSEAAGPTTVEWSDDAPATAEPVPAPPPDGTGPPTTVAIVDGSTITTPSVTVTRPSVPPTVGGSDPTSPPTTSIPTTETVPDPTVPPADDGPGPVTVTGSQTLELMPFSFCWTTLCADGIPSPNPPSIGSSDHFTASFDETDWKFTATIHVQGAPDDFLPQVDLTPTGPTTHRLDAPREPGTYVVMLFGQAQPGAPQRGDVAVTFLWTIV